MVEYVFDTEPLIAFLYTESGHEEVADRLSAVRTGDVDGAIAEVTASELLYLIARIEGDDGRATSESIRVADRDVRSIARQGLSIERADWATVGEIKAAGGVSLGDAHAVALAAERDATLVVGGDGDFEELPVGVDIEQVRDHAV